MADNITKTQCANLIVCLHKVKLKKLLIRSAASDKADTVAQFEKLMVPNPNLNKVLKQSRYYDNGSYLALMRLTGTL